jgi:uncharacterized protein (TIRG00374 family)
MAEEKRKKRWKLIVNIVTLVALAALIYIVRDQIADTISNFREVNSLVLLLMIPAQMLNYDAYVRMYRQLFAQLGHKVSYKNMLRINLELNFVNNVFPSGGVSGFSYFGVRMRKEGVTSGQSTLVQLMRFVLIFVSFQVLLAIGLFILAIEGQASNMVILIAGSLSTLLFVGTVLMTYIIGSKKRINGFFNFITRFLNRAIHIVRKKNPETISVARVEGMFTELHESYLILKKDPKALKWPLFHALVANFAEILTIYIVYIAFNQWVNPGAVIIAYAIANFAGLISIAPGGVGIYEGIMTAVLASAGVAAGVSIPVTIMYRILNMAIQIPPGYYFYHKTVHDDGISARPAK